MPSNHKLFTFAALLFFLAGCGGENIQPKPRGYFRIDTPPATYKTFDTCNFKVEINKKANWVPHKTEACWGNVEYPMLKAEIQLTYKPVEKNLDQLLDDAQTLAFKHSVKADGIGEKLYSHPEMGVHGILFKIEGNAASPAQFFITDSTHHFLRGALYFHAVPNADSLKPVIKFFEGEIIHLMETAQWKQNG